MTSNKHKVQTLAIAIISIPQQLYRMLGEHHWHEFINGKIKRQREMERERKRFLAKYQQFVSG